MQEKCKTFEKKYERECTSLSDESPLIEHEIFYENLKQNLIMMQMLVVTQKGRAILSLSVFLMVQVKKILVLKADL